MNEIERVIRDLNRSIAMLISKTRPSTITCQHCYLYIHRGNYFRCLRGIILSELIKLKKLIREQKSKMNEIDKLIGEFNTNIDMLIGKICPKKNYLSTL